MILTGMNISYLSMAGGFVCVSARIQAEEVTDTSFVLARDTAVTLPWIFDVIIPVQSIGRPEDLNFYKIKSYSSYFGCNKTDSVDVLKAQGKSWILQNKARPQDILDNFVDNDRDTIFIEERIREEGTYSYVFWKNPDNVYDLMSYYGSLGKGSAYAKRCIRIKSLRDSKETDFILSWEKDSLKEYGKNIPNNSNPSSVCVTRAILTPDSVKIDMVKYYSF